LSWKEERDLETIEARILEAEAALALAEAQSNSQDFYKQSPAEMAASHEALISQRQSVAALYARWDELELKRAELKE
jgi:ATP-binding cassette subfamily F protein uup